MIIICLSVCLCLSVSVCLSVCIKDMVEVVRVTLVNSNTESRLIALCLSVCLSV